MRLLRYTVLGALLALGAAGCADLDVVNPNEPETSRALRTGGDVEALIGSTFSQYWTGAQTYTSVGLTLSAMSFHHSASWNNACMVPCSAIPVRPIRNDAADSDYGHISNPWVRNYRAIAAIAQGLRALEENPQLAESINVTRLRAFGRFMQGVSHGQIALLYDQGFIVDETVDVSEPQEAVDHKQVMEAALRYLDEAAQLARGASFALPGSWMTREVPAAELARAASSMKARYRAAVARTPEERAAVNWDAVLADVQAGITSDFLINFQYANTNWKDSNDDLVIDWIGSPGFGWMNYMIHGMADQSGNYQTWLGQPLAQRMPTLPGERPFIIVTPDKRFPQGSTLAEQIASPGRDWVVPNAASPIDYFQFNVGAQWRRPERGTWRWSYYGPRRFLAYFDNEQTEFPEISVREMRLLAAEAHFRKGNRAQAAEIINETRVPNGLSATDAAGANTSCVPKLPNGQCGNLFEMLKWEKRMEVYAPVFNAAPWYFDSRGWGDLYTGIPLELPMPAKDLETIGIAVYTLGGLGGESASKGSTYAWPGER